MRCDNAVVHGEAVREPVHRVVGYMGYFGGALYERQVQELVGYVRQRFGGRR